MATSISTLRERLEAAETAYDTMMVQGRGIVDYREPSGLSIRKDPAEMRAYITYLRSEISARSGSATRTLASFGRHS